MRGPKDKKERALGVKLNLKAERSSSPKSATIRKPYRPGMHGQTRRRGSASDYSLQLKEKQKFKISYGLKEKQIREIFDKAIKSKDVTRDKVFELLERRLDNTVFRLGFVGSRIMARQTVLHGHVTVNGRKVDYPAYLVKKGDKVSITDSSRELSLFKNLTESLQKVDTPTWLLLNPAIITGEVTAIPKEVNMPFDVNLVVEFYSR